MKPTGLINNAFYSVTHHGSDKMIVRDSEPLSMLSNQLEMTACSLYTKMANALKKKKKKHISFNGQIMSQILHASWVQLWTL